ncbi:unnamed protein product [Closterium sp. NIES-53]
MLVDAVIYVEQPHTYGEGDPRVCELRKSLYGIKQVPRLWQQYLHNILLEIGFKKLPHDPGMYRRDFRGEYILLTVYWHDTLRTTLAALGFAPSTADPSLFLRNDTLLPPFYILVYVLQRFDFTYSSPQATPLSTRHLLSALPSNESVEPSGLYPELIDGLMYLMTCTRPDLAYPLSILARYVAPGRHRPEHMAAAKRVLRYLCSTSGMGLVLGGWSPVVLTGHADASWVDDLATQRSSQGYTFSLGSGSVSWRSTCSSSVLSSSCEAEIYAGAMAAQELRWLTYLLTDLGEPPRSPPVLYVDNKAMLALCREHRQEHRTKHIALHYFLARELQQRGQLRLAYVASEANTADIFTKALQPCDHQRFCTMLACFAFLCFARLWQAAMDAEMASWKSTGTYVDEVPPPGANIVSGMWIFRVKRPPGSPPAFKARYVARGFRRDTRAQTWVLQRFGFTYSSPQSTPLPTGHSLSAPPSDESVEPSGPYPELVGCLMYLMTCTRPDLAYPLSLLARYVAPGRHRKVHCREHRLEHRTKHIALRYFLARELQQRGQLRLAYVASQATTADVFTKALQPCDHQHFCTVQGLEQYQHCSQSDFHVNSTNTALN